MTDTMTEAAARKPRKKATVKTAKKTTPAVTDAAAERPTARSPLTRKEATELAATAPRPEDERSGAYIRALLLTPAEDDSGACRFTAAQIVGLVRFHFKHSSAGTSDVNWNRNWLRKHGTPPLALRRA
jgi:hypothetical protein